MKIEEFTFCLQQDSPPEMNIYLTALWYDHKGEWGRAHDLIDPAPGIEAARIHAYLHRKEGDSWNADYWYSRAGFQKPDQSLEDEWEELVSLHLK